MDANTEKLLKYFYIGWTNTELQIRELDVVIQHRAF